MIEVAAVLAVHRLAVRREVEAESQNHVQIDNVDRGIKEAIRGESLKKSLPTLNSSLLTLTRK